jgi:formylmethanofuran dehydrogenase subunit E
LLFQAVSLAQSPAEWVKIGERVHGNFNALIPVGIRIGLDALKQLNARPGEVTVNYIDGTRTPCPCVADGIMMATSATPGQKTLDVALVNAKPDLMGVAVITHRKSGRRLRFEIAASALPRLLEMNGTLDPIGRFGAVMKMQGLYTVIDAGG